MGRYKKIKAIAIILVMAFSCPIWAISELENGNKAFYANQRTEAKSAYQKAILIPKEKAEAYLMLSLLATLEGKESEAFTQFESFFKASENPYPYLFSLWSTESVSGISQKKSFVRLNFLNQLVADPKANGTLKAMAYAALGDHFNASNQFAKSKENFAKIGALDVWSLVGEFENISESGFDKAFEPILKAEENTTFINKNGAKVKWFKMLGNRNDKWLDFTFHYFYENSIIYAQTFANSPVEQEVTFRIGTSGSVKVWLNDALIITEAEERNNDLDTYQAKVKLNKGFNRILVQIGSSEINRSNFLARITDDFGNNVSGINYSAGYQSYNKSTAPLPKVIPIFAESFFEEKVNSEKASVIDYLLLANAHLRNDKGYEARKALATAQKLAPDCSYLKIKQIEAFNRSGNETDAKITIEWLKENDAESLLTLNLFYQEEMDKENFEAATKIVDKIERLYGANEDIIIKRIGLAAREKKQDLLVKLVEAAYKKYPENYGFVTLKVDVEKSMNKSFDVALSVLKKYLKTNFSYEAQKAISDLYFGKGLAAEGLSTFDRIVENAPYTPGFRFNLGKYYFGTRDYAKAETYYQQCINNAPDIFYFWSALAQNFNEKGNSAKAIESYQRALELNPADFESREQLRKLQNKKEVFSYFPKVDVYEIVKKSPAPSTTPDDNSLVLLDEVQKVVYTGGTSEEKRIFVVKIMNEEGINRWKQYYIQHYAMQNFDVEKAEVVKANGSKVEGNSNGAEIVFTNLEVGDAIHVSYKLKSFNGGKLARHFWETFQFSHYMPFLTTRYSLMVEQGIKFDHKFSKEKIEPKVQKLDEFEMYTWEKLNQPALPFEDKMPELSDIGNALYISTIPDWTFVSNWYYDLAASKSKGNLEVKEAVAKLFERKAGLSEMQKARMIYESIVTNIKYLSVAFLQSGLIPQKASHTLNTRLGDCKDVSTLFVAMCREVGIKADLVLIATRNQGKYQMLLPNIDFNHCIARLSSGGKTYFIELTSDKLPFNTFYDNLKNANSLLINSEKSGVRADLVYLNPETRNLNMVLRKTEISLDGNDVKVKKTTIKTGVYASNMRENYRNLGQTDQLKEMQRAIAGDYNQTSIKSISFKGLEGISDTVSYSYKFEAPDAVSEIGGLRLLPMPWSERSKSTDFNFTDDRKFPIDLWNYESDGEEETIELNLPAKMGLAEVPANVQISNAVADYSLVYKQVPGKLLLSRKFRFKKDGIGIDEMKDFQLFYRKVVTADGRQVALKVGSQGRQTGQKTGSQTPEGGSMRKAGGKKGGKGVK